MNWNGHPLAKSTSLRNCESGFSLAENMIAIGLLGLLMVAMMAATSTVFSSLERARAAATESRIMSSLIEEIRADPERYQKNFAPFTTTNSALKTSLGLPIAWSQDYRGPVSGCPTCPGRLGYVIRPTDGFPGLFTVTVWIENPNYFQGSREYSFIVTTK